MFYVVDGSKISTGYSEYSDALNIARKWSEEKQGHGSVIIVQSVSVVKVYHVYVEDFLETKPLDALSREDQE